MPAAVVRDDCTGVGTIGCLSVGSKSPQATPIAVSGKTSNPRKGKSSSLTLRSNAVIMTNFCAMGQKTRWWRKVNSARLNFSK